MIINGDCLSELKKIESEAVDCIITSPPYWNLRDYGIEGQLGREQTPQEYINKLVEIFTECKRALKNTGSLWVNISDSYGGSGSKGNYRKQKQLHGNLGQAESLSQGFKQKSMLAIPQRLSIALIDNGWLLRNTVIWHKPNAMPDSVKDRFTNDFEYFFFFTKSRKYYFERQLEKYKSVPCHKKRDKASEKYKNTNLFSKGARDYYSLGGRNKRTVWTIPTYPFKGCHFATFPEKLIITPLLSCCPEGGTVLDPFCGSGTVGLVAKKLNRQFIGIELNPDYCEIAEERINLLF